MPELNEGFLQGDILPFYLAVRTFDGEPVDQPEALPTIEIGYIDPTTHVRKIPVQRVPMNFMQRGIWTWIWRIPKKEPTTEHIVIMRAMLDDQIVAASDDSYMVTSTVENPDFEIRIDVLLNEGIFLPEVMEGGQKRRRRIVTSAYMREEDIGLNDFALEGDFRFREYPNRVVDRRVAGRFIMTGYVGRHVSSETPGGGSAQRPGDPNPNPTEVTYTQRRRYRY